MALDKSLNKSVYRPYRRLMQESIIKEVKSTLKLVSQGTHLSTTDDELRPRAPSAAVDAASPPKLEIRACTGALGLEHLHLKLELQVSSQSLSHFNR